MGWDQPINSRWVIELRLIALDRCSMTERPQWLNGWCAALRQEWENSFAKSVSPFCRLLRQLSVWTRHPGPDGLAWNCLNNVKPNRLILDGLLVSGSSPVFCLSGRFTLLCSATTNGQWTFTCTAPRKTHGMRSETKKINMFSMIFWLQTANKRAHNARQGNPVWSEERERQRPWHWRRSFYTEPCRCTSALFDFGRFGLHETE